MVKEADVFCAGSWSKFVRISSYLCMNVYKACKWNKFKVRRCTNTSSSVCCNANQQSSIAQATAVQGIWPVLLLLAEKTNLWHVYVPVFTPNIF